MGSVFFFLTELQKKKYSEYRLVADDEVILKLLKRDELLRLFATNPTLSANFYGQICCAIRAQLLAINDAVTFYFFFNFD